MWKLDIMALATVKSYGGKMNLLVQPSYSFKCPSVLTVLSMARITAPDLNGAADIIDRIRNRAGLGKLPQSTRSSKEALLQAYMDERRMELAFEGQRWYDLCRLNKVEEVMNAVYAKDSGRKAQVYAFDKNSYRLPIPQSVIDANDKIQQNPGY